ncbi:MAG: type II toxin-antitoxin system VapC family toxin [Desulfatitalea sp.]
MLDTCVISELVKPQPNVELVDWCGRQNEESLFLSSITIGEIQKGISKLPPSERKKTLQNWLDTDLLDRFGDRIIGIDTKVARMWGEIQAATEKTGLKMPVIDSLIASSGLVYDLTIVTRNVQDMQASGVRLLNPWK